MILGAVSFLVPSGPARQALSLLAVLVSVVAVLTGAWAHPAGRAAAGGGLSRRGSRRSHWQARSRVGRRLAHRALHDGLTGLPNTELFLAHVEKALDRPGSSAVVLLDLDDFKAVNETLGHAAGDDLLVAVAGRLKGCLAPGDVVARLEADEFAVLLPRVEGPAAGEEVARRILAALREPLTVGTRLVTVTAGAGVAVAEDRDPQALFQQAGVALHTAKRAGRGEVRAYAAGMHDALLERVTLETDMRRGLERGEFVAVYQPIVHLDTGTVVGAEALVRWDHPTKGTIPPGHFIAFAEETGLIVPIGREVLRQACLQLAQWDRTFRSGPPLRVNVNLSAAQVHAPGLVADVAAVLDEVPVDPGRVTLEITETVLLQDADAAIATLERLKALGVRLALDDFGTGYSSLSYLHRLPVDVLKVDKSFVDKLGHPGSGHETRLASAIITLGKALELVTTAEGIERGEQVTRLRQLGCRLGQGFFFARPMAAAELAPHLERSQSALRPAPEPARAEEASPSL